MCQRITIFSITTTPISVRDKAIALCFRRCEREMQGARGLMFISYVRFPLLTFFEFADHCGKPGLLSGRGILVNDPFGTCLIQCLDCFAEQQTGIFNVACLYCFDDIFATIPHERAAGTVSISCGNVLAKPFFGTCNVRHTILEFLIHFAKETFYPIFRKGQGSPAMRVPTTGKTDGPMLPRSGAQRLLPTPTFMLESGYRFPLTLCSHVLV